MLNGMYDTANTHRKAKMGRKVRWLSVTRKDFMEEVKLVRP